MIKKIFLGIITGLFDGGFALAWALTRSCGVTEEVAALAVQSQASVGLTMCQILRAVVFVSFIGNHLFQFRPF